MAVPKKSVLQNDSGVRITSQSFDDIIASVRTILNVEILVGVPRETSERPPGLDPVDAKGITNASLAYIHDQGAPEAHIPARPFMRPGITAALPQIQRRLASAMRAAMRGNALVAEQAMQQAGLVAQSSIRNHIDAGIPPPLAEYTLRKRAEKGRRGAMIELDRRAAGLPAGLSFAKPLVDTGEMRKSITYVIRSRRRR